MKLCTAAALCEKLIGTYELRNRESLYMQTEYRLFMLIYLNTENRDPGE